MCAKVKKDSVSYFVEQQVVELPSTPGVYQFLNKEGEVIYVGKAKNLRRRVLSYFVSSRDRSAKVEVLVRQVASIKHIVVDTESDALLLENSLIKELQPRYNILLKDDKSYPWIVVVNEPFPRLLSTRKLVRDGSQYFGPYSSITLQRAILEFVREVIPLRTCSYNLTSVNIDRGRYSACLQYHLGHCKAPCIGAQNKYEYQEMLDIVISILKGDLRPVREYLNANMLRTAEVLNFEEAQRYKMKLELLDSYSHRSVIVSSKIQDVDIFTLLQEDSDLAYCNFVRLRHGSIVGVYTVQITTSIDIEPDALLSYAIANILERTQQEIASEVITEIQPATLPLLDGVTITIPKRGEKMKLIEFSLRSARIFRAEHMKRMERYNPDRHTDRLMAAMQKELHMGREPRHIECFDNSNLQGTNAVSACVVFRDGKPSKREYRHFNVKTVVGADDYATMREVIGRRYSRMIDECGDLPDLVIVDGGKGQLSSAYRVFCELGIDQRVALIGLAKRIEEVFYPNDTIPYYLSRTGEPLKVICRLRDEAHRFGITFHRQKRSNNAIVTGLDGIKGIGSKSKEMLLKRFRSLKRIEAATKEQLVEVIGASKATLVYDHLHMQQKSDSQKNDDTVVELW